MTFSIKNPVACVLTAMACVVLCTATASADIHTFWKTDTCPDFQGTKAALAQVNGVMQAAASTPGLFPAGEGESINGVGGVFCASPDNVTVGGNTKQLNVANANVASIPGDPTAAFFEWACVICQYPDKVIQIQAIPALSLLGTAILMGGLLTACLYELRKRRAAAAA